MKIMRLSLKACSMCRRKLANWAHEASEVLSPPDPSALLNLEDVRRMGLHLVKGVEHGGSSPEYAMAFLSQILQEMKPMHPLL